MSGNYASEHIQEVLEKILNAEFWLPKIETNVVYNRLHDDRDGKLLGELMVQFGDNGDGEIKTDTHKGPALRFRTKNGGGKSLRTRKALMILALAIQLDEEFPEI